MNKSDYVLLFKDWQSSIKFAPYLSRLGINKGNFSRFMNYGEEYQVSLEKLEELKKTISLDISKKIA